MKKIIIAEAWDAAGDYKVLFNILIFIYLIDSCLQVGQFAADHGWSEWNGKFRDIGIFISKYCYYILYLYVFYIVRQFIKGTYGSAGSFAQVVSGSPLLYKITPTTR